MAGINDIPRLKITRNSEVDVGTVAEAGAGALAMVRPMPAPAPTPAPFVRIVGPGFIPSKPPATMPWKAPGFVRWGGVWGIALSLQGDSVPRHLRKLEDDLGELERHIRKEESELDDLLKTPAHTVLTDPEQAKRNNRLVFEKVQRLAVLNMQKELLELKIEQQRLKANGGSDVEISVLGAKIHYLEMTLAEEQASYATTQQRSVGIKASAGGDDAKAPDGDQKAPASQDTPDTGRLPAVVRTDVPAAKESDSKEWQRAAATGDVAEFVKAHDRRIQAISAEVIKRIESRQSYLAISEWFETEIRPELAALNEASQKMSKTPLDGKLLHDARTRRTVLFIRVSPLLKQNRLSEAASICNPPASSLEAQARRLKDAFGDRASFELKGLAGIHLAPHMDPDALSHIFENLVTNAIEHPKSPGAKPHIVIEYNSGILFVTDDGMGMSEETLEGLRQGKRIHDGVEVVHENEESHGHGYGVGEAFKYARLLAADLEYASEVGEGTSVALTPLPGGFVPDASEFILSERGNFDQMRMLVEQMSDANRLLLLNDLAKILDMFADEILPELQQATDARLWRPEDAPPDLEPLRRRAHVVLERYTKYLDLVASHGLDGMRSTERCREVLRILTELLRNISTKMGPVLYR